MNLFLSFVLGVASSLVASWIIFLRRRAKFRLRLQNVLGLITKIADEIRADGFAPDYIVAIDRNSGVVGSILAGHVGIRSIVAVTTVSRRRSNGSREVTLEPISEEILTLLKGQKVLVMVCCNNTGTSLKFVVDFLHDLGSEGPATVKTAATYTSSRPSIHPSYSGAVAGRDTRRAIDHIMVNLPWVTSRWVEPVERLSQTP
jgi:hypoxanthine phosphoribosyltransferase